MPDLDCSPTHPDRGPWWESPWRGGADGEGARPHWRERIPWCNVSMRLISDPDCSPTHPDRGPWWASPWGGGDRGGGASPLPAQGGGTRRSLLVAPTPPGLRPPPPPLSGGGSEWRYPGKTLSGDDNLPERTGRALVDCPSTRIKTVFRGGGRLIADRSIIPETDVRLLNWRYPHESPCRTLAPMGGHPLPVPPP